MPNRLSVIVHHQTEPATLARCLSSLIAQKLCTRELEILVVDEKRRLSVRQLVRWWNNCLAGRGSSTRINYLVVDRSVRFGEQALLRACSGDIIAYIEETAAPPADWAARGVAALLERESSRRLGHSIVHHEDRFERKESLLISEHIDQSIAVASSSRDIAPPNWKSMSSSNTSIRYFEFPEHDSAPERSVFQPLSYYFALLMFTLSMAALFAVELPLAIFAAALGVTVLVTIGATRQRLDESLTRATLRTLWEATAGLLRPIRLLFAKGESRRGKRAQLEATE